MHFTNKHLTIAVLLAAFCFAGCEAKLKDKQTATLEASGAKEFVVPAAKSDRTVVAEVTASEPIRASFLKGADGPPLAEHKELSKSFTLECAQAANQDVTFVITGGPKTSEVTINLSSK